MKLLFEQATFSESLPCKDPYFFKTAIVFARATFSEDVAFSEQLSFDR